MTVIVAVCKGDATVMAADSLTSFGEDRCVPAANSTTPKIRRIGDSALGSAGWAVYDRILDAFLAERTAPDLSSERAIYTFFLDLWRTMHEAYPFVNDQASGKDTPFGDLDSTFLIANRGGIFRVSTDMDVCRFEQFHAIGSGADLALGAMYVLHGQDRAADEIARGAVETAGQYDVYCGGATTVITV
jgi:ATP-dependent protease HslVU (ClpYQ) peptidase subunit